MLEEIWEHESLFHSKFLMLHFGIIFFLKKSKMGSYVAHISTLSTCSQNLTEHYIYFPTIPPIRHKHNFYDTNIDVINIQLLIYKWNKKDDRILFWPKKKASITLDCFKPKILCYEINLTELTLKNYLNCQGNILRFQLPLWDYKSWQQGKSCYRKKQCR